MTHTTLQQQLLGQWISIAPELRPSSLKNPDGSIKPFYLRREFSYLPDDRFELRILNLADAYGQVPLAELVIKGHIHWQGEHPIAPGAQKVNFVADEAYEVKPMLQGFVELLNQIAQKNYHPWEVNVSQSIFKKAFAPFGLSEGQVFEEFDLIYLHQEQLFWGARHVDGRGFDTETNRPTNLQIPMVRG